MEQLPQIETSAISRQNTEPELHNTRDCQHECSLRNEIPIAQLVYAMMPCATFP